MYWTTWLWPRRLPPSPHSHPVALGLSIVAVMLTLGVLDLVEARNDTIHTVQQASDSLATALARDIAQTISFYDRSLQSVGTGVPPGVSPDLGVIFDRLSVADDRGSLLLLDAHGDVVVDTTHAAANKANFSTADY